MKLIVINQEECDPKNLLVITDTDHSILSLQNKGHVDNILMPFKFTDERQFLKDLGIGKGLNLGSHYHEDDEGCRKMDYKQR